MNEESMTKIIIININIIRLNLHANLSDVKSSLK